MNALRFLGWLALGSLLVASCSVDDGYTYGTGGSAQGGGTTGGQSNRGGSGGTSPTGGSGGGNPAEGGSSDGSGGDTEAASGGDTEAASGGDPGANGGRSDSGGAAGESGGSGPENCVSECELGLEQCGSTGVEECRAQGNGCNAWVSTIECGSRQTCVEAGATASCQCEANACTQVGTTCQDGQTVATCARDADACLYVASTRACASPQSCGGTAPSAACSLTCSDSCTQGQTACVGGGLATCTVGTNGCRSYGAPAACPSTHQSCTGTAGTAACTCKADPVCKTAAATCASTTTLANCARDAQGCFFENSSSACSNGACSGGACCTNACTVGQKTCVTGGLATCSVASNGCTAYGSPAACTNTGAVCSGSSCACPSGTTLCGTECVNTATNANHCGACGRSCLAGAAATGQCAASVCQPFTLQGVGPLTPPLLIDPITVPLSSNATKLYATLSGTAAASIDAQSGAILLSPANIYATSNFGPSGLSSQSASTLYGLDNSTGTARLVAITKSTMAASTVSYTQPAGTDLWVGVVPGTVQQLCVLARAGWWVLQCQGTSGTTTVNVCSDGPESSCPGRTAFAADSTGLVWGPEGLSPDEAPPSGFNVLYLSTPAALATPTKLTLPTDTSPRVIAVDAQYIYWFDAGVGKRFYKTVRAAAGTTTQLSSSPIANIPAQLAFDSTHLYWTDTTVGTVSRVALASTSPQAPVVIATGQVGPTGIAVDGSAVYWINGSGNALMKMRKP